MAEHETRPPWPGGAAAVRRMIWELDLPPAEKLVLLALGEGAEGPDAEMKLFVDVLAARAGYSRRQTQRLLRSLEERGAIWTSSLDDGGRHRPRTYNLSLWRAQKRDIGATRRRRKHDTGDTVSRQTGDAGVAVLLGPSLLADALTAARDGTG